MSEIVVQNTPSRLVAAREAAVRVFSEVNFPLSVEEIESRVQTDAGAKAVFELVKTLPSTSLEPLTNVLAELWNHIPRESLGGSTPFEVERRKHQIHAPDGESLPPENSPLWTPEALEGLASSGKPLNGLWVLRWVGEAPIQRAPGVDLVAAARAALKSLSTAQVGEAARRIADWRDLPLGSALGELLVNRFKPEELQQSPGEVVMAVASCCQSPGSLLPRVPTPDDALLYASVIGAMILRRDTDKLRATIDTLLTLVQEDLASTVALAQLASAVESGLGGRQEVRDRPCFFLLASPAEGDAEASARQPGSHLSWAFPAADSQARERAKQVLSHDRLQTLSELTRERKFHKLVREIKPLLEESIELATLQNPEYQPVARIARAVLDALAKVSFTGEHRWTTYYALQLLLNSLLAHAVRGRDSVLERQQAHDDPIRLSRLLSLDADWVDEASFAILVAHASDVELDRVIASGDEIAGELALLVGCARDPQKYLPGLITAPSLWAEQPALRWCLGHVGERILELLQAQSVELGSPRITFLFLEALSALGTERARVWLERNFERLARSGVRPQALVAAAQACSSRAAAEQLADLARAGKLVPDTRDKEQATVAITRELSLLFALCGLDLDAASLLPVEAKQEQTAPGEQHSHAPHHHHDHHGHHHQHGPECGHHRDAEASRTVVREAPKLSRNDPCHCGSGKKHKKCCGRS